MDDKQITELTGLFTEMKSGYAKMGEEVAQHGKATSETIEKQAKLQAEVIAIREKQEKAQADADQFAATMREQVSAIGNGRKQESKSLGELITEDSGFLAAIKQGGRYSVGMKFSGTLQQFATKDITGVSAALPEPITGVFGAPPILPYGVRQLVPQGRTTGGAVEYLVETATTNNAAVVAEGALKPKSEKTFVPSTAPVLTIAHYFKISQQCYQDLPALVSFVEQQGVQQLKYKEDDVLLNGNAAPAMNGFMDVATAVTPAAGVELVDAIGASVFSLMAKGRMPDGAVVNPADWGAVAMTKNSQGNYLFVNPLAYTINGNLWGVRVVPSSNMTAANYLVGAFRGNSMILDRQEVSVQVATQNEDDFIRNMVTILIEERLALLIFAPTAFEKGVLS